MLGDEFAIGDFVCVANTMHQHDFFEALVGFRVLDDTHEWRQARAGAEQVKMLARQQVVEHQCSGWLAADHDLVAFLQVLQSRSQRAVLHLDAEELQILFVVGTGDTVGAHQRTALDL